MNGSEQRLRAEIVEVGRRLYETRLIVAGDGNISVRLPDGRLIVTPTGVNKGYLKPEMLVLTDPAGVTLPGQDYRASSEVAMHVVMYEERPDVKAVVHAHPPVGTGFAAAGMALDRALVSEVVLTLGCIPLAQYGTPSTAELPEAIRPLCRKHDAILLANHGAVTSGGGLVTAFDRMEILEHFARISLVAHVLGGGRDIPAPLISRLMDVREKAGFMAPDRRDQDCRFCAPEIPECGEAAEPVFTMTRRELIDLVARATELTKNR
jgi:L-fuculose-phosphate aldolase